MDIEKIFFINIEKDRERRALMEDRLTRHFPGVPFERVEAVSLPTLDRHRAFFEHRLRPRERPVDGRYPFPGTIGCFISHYLAAKKVSAAWRQRPSGGQAAYLVLEDDCVFDGTVCPAITRGIDPYLPADWQLVKHCLGRFDRADRVNRMFLDVNAARSRDWQYYWGSHFLIYNGSAAAKIAARMETGTLYCHDKWIRDQVDGVYGFAKKMRIKQSNLGGSNTNPAYAGPEHEDRTPQFGSPRLPGWIGNMLRALSPARRRPRATTAD